MPRSTPSTTAYACRRPPRAVDVVTLPYPGFPTDLQPQFIALNSIARRGDGDREPVRGAVPFVNEMVRLGADVTPTATTPSCAARRSCPAPRSRPPTSARARASCWRASWPTARPPSTSRTTPTAATRASSTTSCVWRRRLPRPGHQGIKRLRRLDVALGEPAAAALDGRLRSSYVAKERNAASCRRRRTRSQTRSWSPRREQDRRVTNLTAPVRGAPRSPEMPFRHRQWSALMRSSGTPGCAGCRRSGPGRPGPEQERAQLGDRRAPSAPRRRARRRPRGDRVYSDQPPRVAHSRQRTSGSSVELHDRPSPATAIPVGIGSQTAQSTSTTPDGRRRRLSVHVRTACAGLDVRRPSRTRPHVPTRQPHEAASRDLDGPDEVTKSRPSSATVHRSPSTSSQSRPTASRRRRRAARRPTPRPTEVVLVRRRDEQQLSPPATGTSTIARGAARVPASRTDRPSVSCP